MAKININFFIKTECGRAKFHELSSRKGIFSSIRLFWFILIATIRDWGLKNSTQGSQDKF